MVVAAATAISAVRERIIKNCQVCGKEFRTSERRVRSGRGKYCSFQCKTKGQTKSLTKKCELCGKEFSHIPARVNTVKYCSMKCYSTASRQTRITKKCKWCDKGFWIVPSELVDVGHGQFCSKKCFGESRKSKRVVKHCEQCGKEFKLKPSHAHRGRFCSRHCKRKAQAVPKAWKIDYKKCPVCSKLFIQNHRHNTYRTFCSKTCYFNSEAFRDACKKPKKKFCEVRYKTCPICKKIFSGRPSAIKLKKYCSFLCDDIAHRKEPVTKACKNCGKKISGPPHYMKRPNRNFCSYSCSVSNREIQNPSKFQKEVFEQVKMLYRNSFMEHPIKNWSVDIFVPEKNLCIECDGDYWHSDRFEPGKVEADRLRQIEIEKLGIRVVRIPELQWYKDPNIFRYI